MCYFAEFHQNRSYGHMVVEIQQTFFQDGAVRHLGYVGHMLEDPQRVTGGLYHCANVGWNRYSSFDNTKV